MSTCIRTCLWNMAGVEDPEPDPEPRLYSKRKDIGEVTLCCKSVIERNACIRSALIEARGFPLTIMV